MNESRWIWIILSVIAALVLLPIIIVLVRFTSYRSANTSAIRRLEADIKQKGEPLTLAELAATYPPVPNEVNGAMVLLKIWEIDAPEYWHGPPSARTNLPPRPADKYDRTTPFLGSDSQAIGRGALTPASRAAAEAWSKKNQSYLDSVRSALRYPQFRFPVHITNGFEALLPHLAEVKRDASLLRIEALLACERGDVHGAITNLEEVARMGKVLEAEPLIISQLVRIACYGMVLEDSQRLLSRRALSAGDLERLDLLLDQLQAAGILRSALVAERAFFQTAFDPQSRGQAFVFPEFEGAPKGFAIGTLKASGLLDADHRLMLETMQKAIMLADRNDPESLEQFEALISSAVDDARKPPPKVISAMLLPAEQKAEARFTSFEARRRAGKVAIAVERFQMARGHLPDRLEELVPQFLPEIPGDPFDGPLHFRSLTNGFVVYSIGANRIDDGGKEKIGKSLGTDYDDTFVVER